MANPINNKNNCSTLVSANCVKWPISMTLSPIELCEGDSVTDVIIKNINLSQEILASIDLSLVDLSCLSSCDACGIGCDTDKTITNLFNCLFAQHCELVTTVSGLTSTSTLSGLLNVDLTCILALTGSTVPSIITNDFIIQQVINGACLNATAITGINNSITTIEADIVDIRATCCTSGGSVPYVNTDSCGILTQATAVNLAVEALMTDYCSLRTLITNTNLSDLAININPTAACALSINTELGLTGTGNPGQAGNQVGEAANIEDTLGDMWNVMCQLSTTLYNFINNTSTTCDFTLATDGSSLNVTITYIRNAVTSSFVVSSATTSSDFSLPSDAVVTSVVNNINDTVVSISSSTSCATPVITNNTSICRRIILTDTYNSVFTGTTYEWYLDEVKIDGVSVSFTDQIVPHVLTTVGYHSSETAAYTCDGNSYTYVAQLAAIKDVINNAIIAAGITNTSVSCLSGDMANNSSAILFSSIVGIDVDVRLTKRASTVQVDQARVDSNVPGSCECCDV